jgi:hypothetical protein
MNATDRSPRRDAQQETHLRLIQIPNTGHDPLIEQGEAEFHLRLLA